MDRPLSLTPSISHLLDQMRLNSGQGSAAGPEAPSLAHWREVTDVLGLAVFVLMLGSYLAANL
jgi:hypothetical protein